LALAFVEEPIIMLGELALQTLSDDCEDLLHDAYLLIEAGDSSGADVDLPSLISQIEQCADRCASLDVAYDFGEAALLPRRIAAALELIFWRYCWEFDPNICTSQ
jgi:hypothetical protein